jgi:hypothetical protein
MSKSYIIVYNECDLSLMVLLLLVSCDHMNVCPMNIFWILRLFDLCHMVLLFCMCVVQNRQLLVECAIEKNSKTLQGKMWRKTNYH